MKKEFIKANYLEMSDEELGQELGLTKQTVKTYRCKMGLFRFEQEQCAPIKGELWKVVEEFPLYEVSNKGRIRRGANIVQSSINERGYLIARFCTNGIRQSRRLQRVVAKAFIPNPENKPEVNHIDGNKLNNSVYNLEWNTRSENIQHMWDTGLRK